MKTTLDSLDLTLNILHKEDWESASQIVEIIYQENQSRKISTFLKISSKTLLTSVIILCNQTIYPDLLSVKSFLLLPQLKKRLCHADSQQKLIKYYGSEVDNGLQQFTCCPSSEPILEIIIIEAIRAIDCYYYQINKTYSNSDLKARYNYFKQLFPLPKPKTESQSKMAAIFKKARQLSAYCF